MWFHKDKPSLSESLMGWLMGEDKPTTDLTREAKVIEVRLRIIRTLKQCGLAEGAPLLLRVARTPALEDLWYLRPEIMQTLSALHGDATARSIMTGDIAPLFMGSLPAPLLKQNSVSTRTKDSA